MAARLTSDRSTDEGRWREAPPLFSCKETHNVKRLMTASSVLLLGLFLASCGGSTQLVETWAEPTYKPKPTPKVMVVALGENERRVKSFEDIFGSYFVARKIEMLKGNELKATNVPDVEAFKKIVHDSGADLCVITKLVDITDETVYHPGTTSYVPVTGYYGMGYYYQSSYAMVNDPGYISTSKVYKIETNVYDVATEKLIWSGLSETTDPADFEDGVNSFAAVVVGDLVTRKIVP
jgi:hypothetical protein